MRIRNAAVAGATALALTFGGSTVAFAQDTAPTAVEDQNLPKTAKGGVADTTPEDYKPSLSSKIGNKLEGDKEANGADIFGSTKDLKGQPKWAKTAYGVGVASAVASVIGLIGVVYNFFVHGPSF
ncbi:hypothetical protein ACKFRM_07810 [Corynebacterium sp. YSMAA1_1_D6]|uniref:hypothetical protein n=1 Tax=Corynebacterium sp. YSMAA1_1_D6 TaxID=3383589 RepID=UPI0025D66373|nr:hypothetical protein [uncultured Corynebacterium sp.]